ncbi:MAG: PorV/PorQ family protein [Candidatus Marinimicrobia bacterium]|nr:PorV/PorQ family protein [Candidatus Neomarinimicrobiota bacterium]
MKKDTAIRIFLILGILSSYLFGQTVSKVGTSAANFLKIPIDAVATSRGEAVVTGFNNPATLYYNPSTLALITEPTAHFSYVDWYEGISLNQAAMVIPVPIGGVIGLNVISLSSGQMEITTELDQDGTGDFFEVSDIQLGLAFARSLTDRFMIGANAKVFRETIYNTHAQGFGLDVGGRYVTPWPGLVLGFSINNFGTKMQMTGDDLLTTVDPDPLNSGNNDIINAYYSTDRFDIPLRMIIGAGWQVIDSQVLSLHVEADGVYPSDNYEWVNIGAHLGVMNDLLYLSAGRSHMFLPENDPQNSLGGGLSTRIFGGVMMQIDYAVQSHAYFNYNEHFSISLRYR